MEKSYRPALTPYVKLYGGLSVAAVAMAGVGSLLDPGHSLVVWAAGGLLALFGIYQMGQYAYAHFVTEYRIDDAEITSVHGFWAKDETHVPIDKIEDYSVDRSILSKLLGLADIGLQTARGEHGFEVTLHSIPEAAVHELDAFLDRQVRVKGK